MPLNVEQAQNVIHVTSATAQLLQLDELWTAIAVQSTVPSGLEAVRGQMHQVNSVVSEMDRLILDVSYGSKQLFEYADRISTEAEEALSSLLRADDLLDDRDRMGLTWWINDIALDQQPWSTDFDRVAKATAAVLDIHNGEAERGALGQQFEQLRSGMPGTGDLSRNFRCGAAQQLLVGGVLLLPGVAGGGIALGVASGVVAASVVASTGGIGALAIIGAALYWAKKHSC